MAAGKMRGHKPEDVFGLAVFGVDESFSLGVAVRTGYCAGFDAMLRPPYPGPGEISGEPWDQSGCWSLRHCGTRCS
jgi:hypothetical protein